MAEPSWRRYSLVWPAWAPGHTTPTSSRGRRATQANAATAPIWSTPCRPIPRSGGAGTAVPPVFRALLLGLALRLAGGCIGRENGNGIACSTSCSEMDRLSGSKRAGERSGGLEMEYADLRCQEIIWHGEDGLALGLNTHAETEE